jgi:tetratricopeptide (TPR) repeat protein
MNRGRARQWSRTAYALAAVFASFPIAGRLLLGEWTFEGATGLAGLWLAIGVYLHIRSRRLKAIPDPAAILDEALQLLSSGDPDGAFALLDRAILESPRFWQAYQHRGLARLQFGDTSAALSDFDEAIRLAPDEPQLYELRSRAETLLREI